MKKQFSTARNFLSNTHHLRNEHIQNPQDLSQAVVQMMSMKMKELIQNTKMLQMEIESLERKILTMSELLSQRIENFDQQQYDVVLYNNGFESSITRLNIYDIPVKQKFQPVVGNLVKGKTSINPRKISFICLQE
jgi:hypothetical protein